MRVAAARRTVLTVRVLPVQRPVDGGRARAVARRDASRRAAAAIRAALPGPAVDPRPVPARHAVATPVAAPVAAVTLTSVERADVREVDRVA